MSEGKSGGCAEGLHRLGWLATLVLIALRADGVIAWPWWWLLAPPACALALVVVSLVIVAVGEAR